MLLVRHAATVQPKIHPCRIIFIAADPHRAFYDEKISVFVFDEVFLRLDTLQLLAYEFFECFIAGTDTCTKPYLALVIFIIEQVEVVARIITGIHDA